MEKEKININQIKQHVINDLKTLSLLKKDRIFLLNLIELFDWLTEDENERFLNKLQKLILSENVEKDQELEARLYSLRSQMDSSRYLEIRHFPSFSMFFQKEKIDIYPKRLPMTWDLLTSEIKKINFSNMQVSVYKSVTKKEKMLNVKLSFDKWEDELVKILDNNIFSNVRIILYMQKDTL